VGTVVYRNAVLLLNGAELQGALHELAVEYSAEILDRTTFGADTRIKQGGLLVGKVSGKGYFDTSLGLEGILFPQMGGGLAVAANPAYQSGAVVEDTILLLFPDGVTENSLTTGRGYAMKSVLSSLSLGGLVGTELGVDFAAESRGVSA
jgi:hypothetical protein